MSRCLAGGVQWYFQTAGVCCNRTLVLLHGFAQSGGSWDLLLPFLAPHFQIVLVDLPGHGKTPLPEHREMTLAELGAAVCGLVTSITSNQVHLCGYSFGGRVALHAALRDQEKFESLTLIGASTGIANEKERAERSKSDHLLAKHIRERGVEWFVNYWEDLPFFATQKTLPLEVREQIRKGRLACDAEGLAFALEKFGTGEQNYLIPKLETISSPVLLLAGELDKKFCESNRVMEMALTAAQVTRIEIAEAGHAVQMEKPEDVGKAILGKLKTEKSDRIKL